MMVKVYKFVLHFLGDNVQMRGKGALDFGIVPWFRMVTA